MTFQNAPHKWDILGFGAIAVDDLIEVEIFPLPDSKTRVLNQERHGGGLCATALVAASRLGSQTAFCGVLGNDELSQWSRQELEKGGVDTSQVLADDDARPHHSHIVVARADGTRTIFSDGRGVKSVPSQHITRELIRRAKVIFLDHTVGESGSAITMAAQSCGVPIVADIERIAPEVETWIERVNHLIISENFAREWTGISDIETVAHRLGNHRALAVITRGANGCIACGKETRLQVLAERAYRVNVVDTTGCGDVFHGAYASELARGSEVWTRLKIAGATASIKAQFRGGRGGLPNRDEVLRFIGKFPQV